MAIKKTGQALDAAEQVIDLMVKELHACLWSSLSPNAAEVLAGSLVRRLRSLKEVMRAKEALAASDARQEWHRAADIIQYWWSQSGRGTSFLGPDFKEKQDLRPPTGVRKVHEGLADLG